VAPSTLAWSHPAPSVPMLTLSRGFVFSSEGHRTGTHQKLLQVDCHGIAKAQVAAQICGIHARQWPLAMHGRLNFSKSPCATVMGSTNYKTFPSPPEVRGTAPPGSSEQMKKPLSLTSCPPLQHLSPHTCSHQAHRVLGEAG
jgi:hypothetical protein